MDHGLCFQDPIPRCIFLSHSWFRIKKTTYLVVKNFLVSTFSVNTAVLRELEYLPWLYRFTGLDLRKIFPHIVFNVFVSILNFKRPTCSFYLHFEFRSANKENIKSKGYFKDSPRVEHKLITTCSNRFNPTIRVPSERDNTGKVWFVYWLGQT